MIPPVFEVKVTPSVVHAALLEADNVGMTIGQVAAFFRIDDATMRPIVTRLAADGLVVRNGDVFYGVTLEARKKNDDAKVLGVIQRSGAFGLNVMEVSDSGVLPVDRVLPTLRRLLKRRLLVQTSDINGTRWCYAGVKP